MTTQLPSKHPWKSSREPLGVGEPQVENHWHRSCVPSYAHVYND